MANITSDLASTLTQEEIPIKLRCASCNKLVVNAFRLPCCDQSICENCEAVLPVSCPVCAHSPLSSGDCKPNKALRLTVKAFLKNEEKKRDKERSEAKAATQPEVESIIAIAEADIALPTTEKDDAPVETEALSELPEERANEASQTLDGATPAAQPDHTPVASDTVLETTEREDDVEKSVTAQPQPQGEETGRSLITANKNLTAQPNLNGLFNQTGMANGFGNNSWTGPGMFNPMMAMNGMNGMNGMNMMNNGWGGMPNMMGMGMDPMMMSQGMFGGFNGGMGMNGMNMGMGFDGSYGGWAGNNAMGGMGGMMNGDFGGANAGYYPSGGYNQQSSSHHGHFNQMQSSQQFSRPMNNYQQNRFQGGRGGYAQSKDYGRDRQAQYSQQTGQHQSYAKENVGSGDRPPSRAVDEFGRDVPNPAVDEETSKLDDSGDAANTKDQDLKLDAQQDGARNQANETTHENPTSITNGDREEANHDDLRPGGPQGMDDEQQVERHSATELAPTTDQEEREPSLQPITVLTTVEESYDEPVYNPMTELVPAGLAIPIGPASQYFPSGPQDFNRRSRGGLRGFGRGSFDVRGGFRGRGGFAQSIGFAEVLPVEPIGQGVVGAPTGPKAMRDGMPNTGFRGRGGFQVAGRDAKIPGVPNAPASISMDNSMNDQAGSRTRSPSVSQPTAPSQNRQERRSRSTSVVENDEGQDHRREKRRSSRKYDDEERAIDKAPSRSRHSSPDSGLHLRSRHDNDKHRLSRRDRSRDRSRHRHRSRSARRDRADLNDAHSSKPERSSKRDESRHRTRDRKDKDRRRSRRDRTDSPEKSREEPDRYDRGSRKDRASRRTEHIPTEPREFKIKDRSKLKPEEVPTNLARDERSDVDVHTMEREARNRERLLKEQERRRGSVTSVNGGSSEKKRNREGVDGADGEVRSSRRKRHDKDGRRRATYKYEDEENDEDRAARIENEREAARWE